MDHVAVIELEPGPLADPRAPTCEHLVASLEVHADSRPRALLLLAPRGVGAAEPRPSTPRGVRDPAALIAAFPAPTIAAWDGAALGAGAEVVLAADLRVAGLSATLAFPEVGLGELPCWGGTQRVTRVAGPAFALRLLVVGDEADAVALARHGVATCAADAMEHARALAARMAAGAPRAQQAARDAVQRGLDLTLADGLRLESDLNLLLSTTLDRAEGIAAFFDKRDPDFTGE
jgi:enoyl-CoA hydratase/carnithine racemase